MRSSRKLRLTVEADDDLRQIATYTLERWGERQVGQYLDELVKSMETLRQFPDRGALVRLKPGLLSIPARNHTIYYRILSGDIEVIRIIHHRRNAAAELEPF